MMQLAERWNNLEESFRSAVDEMRKDTWHALPVIVAQDSDGKTVVVQPTIKVSVRQADGTSKEVQMPPLNDVPIHFAGGGGVTITQQVKKGDEGFVIFTSRAHDSWFQNGDVQPAVDSRASVHSDAIYVPGLRSTPRALSNISTDSAQVRSDDGKHTVDLHPSDGVTIKSVDPSDAAADPYKDAKKYSESAVHPTDGVSHSVNDGGATHGSYLTYADGFTASAANGEHSVSVHPSNGASIKSSAKVSVSAPQHTIDAATTISQTLNVAGALTAASIAAGSISFGGGGGTFHVQAPGKFDGALQAQSFASDTTFSTAGYTVADLNTHFPASVTYRGLRAYVTDALTPSFLNALIGGGSVVCPAFCDGLHWVAG